ncbi:MAG: ATP-binding protein [Coriobacteriia bacterium]|nr:ATP-binding protein [Coriobacteriia bacterium]
MKRVVFASGKGGTGKTTLTALVARLISAERSIVLADCDVEAANLPIALGADAISCEPFAGGAKAQIDPAACRGCGACQTVCRFEAIGAAEDFFRNHVFRIDQWACEGCGVCVPACPDGAIRMEPSQAGEACRAETPIGPMAFGRLVPGEDLSGKLVTEVRMQADSMAESQGAELLLIDGPPGVGCPAIASITNTDLLVAVTEPTLSGEHDLMRLVSLARRLDVPVTVVLNKADLSESGARRIRARVQDEGLELMAEVPYDTGIACTLIAQGASTDGIAPASADAVAAVVRWLAERIG